jgi:hypothetical protein
VSVAQTVGGVVVRRQRRKWARRAWVLVGLLILGAGLAVGLAVGLPAAAEVATDRAVEAVTPGLPDDVWTPVVTVRDELADQVYSLPPPSLIVQHARELVWGDG